MRLVLFLASCLSAAACTETVHSSAQFADLSPAMRADLQKGAYEQNCGPCAYRLALYYAMTENDDEQSKHWYKVAAEKGDGQGMYAYGSILEQKADMEDRKQARYWLRKAVAKNEGTSSEKLAAEKLRVMDEDDRNR